MFVFMKNIGQRLWVMETDSSCAVGADVIGNAAGRFGDGDGTLLMGSQDGFLVPAICRRQSSWERIRDGGLRGR